MSEIRISPTAQVITLLVSAAAVTAAIVAQLPEIRRYLKLESM